MWNVPSKERNRNELTMDIGITERGDAAINHKWKKWLGDGNPTILITKDPARLYKVLCKIHLLDSPNYIVHCTITGFGGTILEPQVPNRDHGINGYRAFLNKLPMDRVVLRIDPIIPSVKGIATAVGIEIQAPPDARIRISFLDMYKHVMERFEKAKLPLPYGREFHALLKRRKEVIALLQKSVNRSIEVCGEPDIECIGCISKIDLSALGIQLDQTKEKSTQRRACTCLSLKHELLSGRRRCPHGCLYCYWKG